MGISRRKLLGGVILSTVGIGLCDEAFAEKTPDGDLSRMIESIDFTGSKDSSEGFQNLIDLAEKISTKVGNGLNKVKLEISGVIALSKEISIDASKLSICGPATIIFKKIAKGDFCIRLKNIGLSGAAYTNGVGSFFDGVNFISEGRDDLFYAENANVTATGSNPSCLINISQCRFTGFGKVFTNGEGGWGWNWDRCGFNSCGNLLFLTSKRDSYERFSFLSCIWQNGGVAFYVDNPLGEIYWRDGSMDYCDGIAEIKNGHVFVSGHSEFSPKSEPFVKVRGEYSTFSYSEGAIYIVGNAKAYTIIDQEYPNSARLDNVVLMSHNCKKKTLVLSNVDYIKGTVRYASSESVFAFK